MSQRKQPDRISKKRANEMMAKPRKFDIIGQLQSNYGEMTGGNICREIFGYLDFSTLQQGRLVSKSWNFFLSNDKKIWLQALKKQLPNLIHFTNQLVANEEENSTFWKEIWSSIEKEDNMGPKELIDSFKKVQHIFEIVKICASQRNFNTVDFLPFHDDFVGEKVKKEIQREIKKNENLLKYPWFEPRTNNERHVSERIAQSIGKWMIWIRSPRLYQVYHDTELEHRDKLLNEIKNYLLNN